MKLVTVLLVTAAYAVFPLNSWSKEPHVVPVATELQTKLLSLELPAGTTDREKVGSAMEAFARDHGFTSAEGPRSSLWNIQRMYVGPNYTSVVLSLFPEHTFVVLSKRPGDGDTHQDLADALTATFGPLGFKPWVEPPS